MLYEIVIGIVDFMCTFDFEMFLFCRWRVKGLYTGLSIYAYIILYVWTVYFYPDFVSKIFINFGLVVLKKFFYTVSNVNFSMILQIVRLYSVGINKLITN